MEYLLIVQNSVAIQIQIHAGDPDPDPYPSLLYPSLPPLWQNPTIRQSDNPRKKYSIHLSIHS